MELDPLKMKRIAAWALNHLTNHYGLGTMAERFNGDDGQWVVDVPIKAVALRSSRTVAIVEFQDIQVTIYIPDIYQIIRSGHLKEFNPSEYGIQTKNTEDFKGGIEDDIVAELMVDTDLITGFDGPHRPIPMTTIGRKFKIQGSMR